MTRKSVAVAAVLACSLCWGTLLSTPAMATFTQTDLILTVYNKNDMEVGLDLGLDLTTYDFAAASNDTVLTGGWSLDDFGVGLTSLSAGVYGMTPPTDPDYYNVNLFFATTQPTAPGFGQSSYVSFLGGFGNVILQYNLFATDGKYVQTAGKPGSYVASMNSNGNVPGFYTGLNLNHSAGEVKLASSYVDMYLYKVLAGITVDTEEDFVNLVPGADHDYQAVIRLFDNGDVVVNPLMADSTPPLVTITNPLSDKTVKFADYALTGTASEVETAVSSVEVSVDNGATWHPAVLSGTGPWTWSVDAALAAGTNAIQVRATSGGGTSNPLVGATLTFQAIGLDDAIVALQVVAGLPVGQYYHDLTTRGVGPGWGVGVEDALYALQKVAGLR